VDQHSRKVTVTVTGSAPASSVLVEALRQLDAETVSVLDLAVRRPTLDDVFLSLTGHTAEPGDEQPAPEPTMDGQVVR
jgi:ABC-2 type transport system ATP-binding protein